MPIYRIRTHINQAPWVSNEFLVLIDNREHKAKLFRKNPTTANKEILKIAKNQVHRLRQKLKKSYIETTSKYPNDPKSLSHMIQTFWPNNKSTSNHVSSINNLTDNRDMANYLNLYFCSTGKRIQSMIHSTASLGDFPYPHLPTVFEISEITLNDIPEAINTLSSSPSSSIYHVTALMIKSAKNELILILHYLFNLSVSQRVFPKC